MAGIVFLRTRDLEGMKRFYTEEIGMRVWLEQAECALLAHENFLVGFCSGPEAEVSGLLTFFYPGRAGVDAMYAKMKERALKPPAENDRYGIYHFFARDPEDRALEFQAFLHPVLPYLDAETLLATRRSVREFLPDPVGAGALDRVFGSCRFAPTSMHSQSCDFVVVRNRKVLEELAAIRGSSSAPLARAPMGVAVCGDPSRSGAHRQDACIAAYHFLLAAWANGLGTCWIGAMDRPEVKSALGVPGSHYVATVTPLGYPAERPGPRPRRPAAEIVRFVD